MASEECQFFDLVKRSFSGLYCVAFYAYITTVFLFLFLAKIKKKKKYQIFDQNHGLTPPRRIQIFPFLISIIFLVYIALLSRTLPNCCFFPILNKNKKTETV